MGPRNRRISYHHTNTHTNTHTHTHTHTQMAQYIQLAYKGLQYSNCYKVRATINVVRGVHFHLAGKEGDEYKVEIYKLTKQGNNPENQRI